jgi:hypothetical protein
MKNVEGLARITKLISEQGELPEGDFVALIYARRIQGDEMEVCSGFIGTDTENGAGLLIHAARGITQGEVSRVNEDGAPMDAVN